jgi:heme A synthase
MQTLVGEGKELTILQMSVRAFAMFIIYVVLIRIAGLRTFAKQSTFDNIIVIMLGAVLARGVVGASPFLVNSRGICCNGGNASCYSMGSCKKSKI